jgi:DNA helicase TIP49 (TBP-interacting protein)
MGGRRKNVAMNFTGMPQVDVPQGRNGKHKAIVTKILSDLDQAQQGVALKVPLAQLTDIKENVRAALNRATRKGGRSVATASDDTFLYVWNETPTKRAGSD